MTAAYDWLICFLQYLILFKFFTEFFESRGRGAWFTGGVLLCSATVHAAVNQAHIMLLNLAVGLLLALAVNFLLFHGARGMRIFLSVFGVSVGVGIEIVTLSLISALIRERLAIVSGDSVFQFIFSILNQLLYFFLLHLISFLFAKRRTFREKGALPLLFLPFTGMLCGASLLFLDRWVPTGETFPNFVIAIACLCLVLSNLLCFFVYDKSMERHELMAKYETLEYGNRTQLSYYHRLKEHLDNMRIYRHDMGNQLLVMEKMLLSGKTQAVLEHLAALRAKNTQGRELITLDCNNPAINAILQETMSRCQERGIAFSIMAQYSDLSFIDSIDACAIFANILGNAVEACEKLNWPDAQKRIVITLNRQHDILMLTVENSANPPAVTYMRVLHSSKGGNNHGLGLLSASKAAKNYGGEVLFQFEEGIFTTIVRLNITQK